MSARRSRQAALCLFGRRGCEATPLSAIAADAGIRTPSIHAHFAARKTFSVTCSTRPWPVSCWCSRRRSPRRPTSRKVCRYLEETIIRYDSTPQLPFLLRSICLPPVVLADYIRE